jgi:hypothetical protein
MITLPIMRFLQTRAVWPYIVCNNVIFASFHWVTRLLLLHSCTSTDHILTLRSSDVEQMTWHSGSYDTENITPCWKSDEGNRNHTDYYTVYKPPILTLKYSLLFCPCSLCALYSSYNTQELAFTCPMSNTSWLFRSCILFCCGRE